MSKHTPGPWIVHENTNLITAENYIVCENIAPTHPRGLPEWDERTRATARLIAAAPELLEALKTMLADDPQFTARAKAEAAIAKAEGA
jgi:hypothetical protein